MTDHITTKNSADTEIGGLVYCVIGVCIFLGFEDRGGDEDFIKVAHVKNDGSREVSWTLRSYICNPRTIDDLARCYRASMDFYDRSAHRDERFDSGVEDLIQRARADAHALACSSVQRIRDLDEPHNVAAASVFLDFAERSGADAQTMERRRAALAEARECRRVEMGHAPFCAATYFTKVRESGGEPYVRLDELGGLGIGFSVEGHEKRDHIMAWANFEDPDRALRHEYARSVWEARPASDRPVERQFVPLGV